MRGKWCDLFICNNSAVNYPTESAASRAQVNLLAPLLACWRWSVTRPPPCLGRSVPACHCRTVCLQLQAAVQSQRSPALQVNAVPGRSWRQPFWVIVMRASSCDHIWVKDQNYLLFYFISYFQSSETYFFVFRMRAKTSEFLKVLNRAKIEEENTKKKASFMGNRGQFIWKLRNFPVL